MHAGIFTHKLLLSTQEETQSWGKSEVIWNFGSSFCVALLIPGKEHPAETDAGVQGEKGCDWKYFLRAKVGAGFLNPMGCLAVCWWSTAQCEQQWEKEANISLQ